MNSLFGHYQAEIVVDLARKKHYYSSRIGPTADKRETEREGDEWLSAPAARPSQSTLRHPIFPSHIHSSSSSHNPPCSLFPCAGNSEPAQHRHPGSLSDRRRAPSFTIGLVLAGPPLLASHQPPVTTTTTHLHSLLTLPPWPTHRLRNLPLQLLPLLPPRLRLKLLQHRKIPPPRLSSPNKNQIPLTTPWMRLSNKTST